jgi:endoglucanase
MLKKNFPKSWRHGVWGFSKIALSGFTCLTFVALSFGAAKPPIYGQLSIKGGHFVNAAGQNVQLKGMSMYAWTPAAIGFYNTTAIGHLAQDWKCTAIRIPYMSKGSVTMAQLDSVIQGCVNNGIYAIVDWHGGSNSDVASPTKFFQTVATRWHTVPNIMYEPENEPSGAGVTWPTIKPYMETVIAAIRAIDPTNIIICGNPQWDQQPQSVLQAPGPITDATNIAYTMHFYAASHPVGSYGKGIKTSMAGGLAIFITEYGTCNASGHAPLNLPATTAWYNFLDSNMIGSTNWGVEAEDIDGAACFTKAASKTGPWADNVLNGDATFVRTYIMKAVPNQPPVEVLPNEFKIQRGVHAPAMNELLFGANAKSAMFTVNGMRCSAGDKLTNGLYVFPVPGKSGAKVINVGR